MINLNAPANKLAPRTALMEMLDNLSDRKVIYVHAPAGYGKTISANLWLARQQKDKALITLDEFDNKGNYFYRKFCSALLNIQPDNEKLKEYAFDAAFDSAPAEFAMHAVSSLYPGTEAIIAFDDLHFIQNKNMLRFLPAMIKRLPPQTKLLISSRYAPPEIFSELILKNDLAIIPHTMLIFNRDEIKALFLNNGITITDGQSETLYKYTEGWAIGVNAAMLSGTTVPKEKISVNYLNHFIQTQIWEKWDRQIRSFLLKTAFEKELIPELCTVLTGEKESFEMLESLVEKNAFITKSNSGSYRVHKLFRSFLLNLFYEKGENFAFKQYKLVGEWYFQQHEYLKAISYFTKCHYEQGIAQCLISLVSAKKQGIFEIDKMFELATNPDVMAAVKNNDYFLSIKAWADFLGGYPEKFIKNLDLYYQWYLSKKQDVAKNDYSVYYLYCIDYRYSISKIASDLQNTELNTTQLVASGTVTQNMPLFHRSTRDFSEYAVNEGKFDLKNLIVLPKRIFGQEHALFHNALVAGLKYEQGKLNEAYRYALEANSNIKPDFAPEGRFCALAILAQISVATWDFENARAIIKRIEYMIEQDKLFHLSYNLNAYKYCFLIENGNMNAAAEWLEINGTTPFEHVSFYKLYGFFTTSRAYISLGKYDDAIIILKKILHLCEEYKRTLDIIEAHILMAIAYWKKKRNMQEAFSHLEIAISIAYKHGYTQAFANEGVEIVNMLYKLYSKASKKDYNGDLPAPFIKILYINASEQAKHLKGLTAGRAENITFTDQQLRVMNLLCNGNSYNQIAEILGIKFSTVRSHIELIYKKLDVPNEGEAIAKIKRLEILEENEDLFE